MNPHPFTLRQLQYAVAVAETGGFRRAAERCHVSQPSLSAQLGQLESVLGVRLFERNRRRVLVTSAGQELINRARRALTDADDLIGCAKGFQDPLAGTMRIGIIPTISPYLLPEIVRSLRDKYPRLSILWSEEKTGTLLGDLAAGRLDAILLALVSAMEDLDREVIGEDSFVLAGRPTHPLLRKKGPVHPRDLDGQPVLLLEDGHCFREQALALCANASAREADFRATSLSTLAQMAAAGTGITLLPAISLAVENRRSELAVRRFASPAARRTLVLAWRKPSPLGPGLRELAQAIRASYPRLVQTSGAAS